MGSIQLVMVQVEGIRVQQVTVETIMFETRRLLAYFHDQPFNRLVARPPSEVFLLTWGGGGTGLLLVALLVALGGGGQLLGMLTWLGLAPEARRALRG